MTATQRKGGKHKYYKCPNPESGHRHYFQAAQIDQNIWEWFEGIRSDKKKLLKSFEEWVEGVKKQIAPTEKRLEYLNRKMEKAEDDQQKVLDLYLDGSIPKEILAARLNELKSQIESFDEEIIYVEHERDVLVEMLMGDVEGTYQDVLKTREISEKWVEIQRKRKIESGDDFKLRRADIERYDVRAEITEDNGRFLIEVTAKFGQKGVVDYVYNDLSLGYGQP